MEIKELEDVLGVTITGTPQEARYTALLSGSIAHINEQCGKRFTITTAPIPPATVPNVTVTLPIDVRIGAALLVKAAMENQSVASQSLADMSKSFFEGGGYKAAAKWWRGYRKARFF